jgi:hypothetical protein
LTVVQLITLLLLQICLSIVVRILFYHRLLCLVENRLQLLLPGLCL